MKTEPENSQAVALAATLAVAVPLRIAELDIMTTARQWETITQWSADAANSVAHRGDVLQYGGKPGQAADAFNHLARGIAALAHQPGGVAVFGTLWCAEHHPGGVPGPQYCAECEDDYWPSDDEGPVPRECIQKIEVVRLSEKYEGIL